MIACGTTGNVGIGTDAPTEILTVDGNIVSAADSTDCLGVTANHWASMYGDSAYFGSTASGTYAGSPGTVNIGGGTTASTLMFHLNDTTVVQNQSLGSISWWNNDSGEGDVSRATIDVQATGTGGQVAYMFGIHDSTADEMDTVLYVEYDGETPGVGIGADVFSPASPPEAPLHVEGASGDILKVERTSVASLTVNATTDVIRLSEGSASDDNQLVLKSDGLVGIGTASPSRLLSVKGALGLETTDSTNDWVVYAHTDDTLRFNFNGAGSDEVTIDCAGNVGIGVASPNCLFDVGGKFAVNSSGAAYWGDARDYGVLTWDTGKAIVAGLASKCLVLQSASTDAVTIDTSQNVGIGTTAPQTL